MSKTCRHPTCGDECRRPKPEKKPRKIPKVSKKMSKAMNKYSREKARFMQDNPECKAAIFPICDYQATEVHHMAGRENGLLLEKSLWLPICRNCHEYATTHSREAIEMGLSVSKHKKAS